jgi:hypothetical protein
MAVHKFEGEVSFAYCAQVWRGRFALQLVEGGVYRSLIEGLVQRKFQ